jgi:hypothetical protein
VGGIDEFAEGGVAAEERIDGEIVVGVVSMIGRRREDGIKVKCGDAKLLQVIKVFGNAAEVPPLETERGWWAVPGLEVEILGEATALGETIRKDLIEDRVFDPLRRDDRHAPSFDRKGSLDEYTIAIV